jgi:hypothetical protein
MESSIERPGAFPVLPIIEEIVRRAERTEPKPLEGLIFVCVQHLLSTFGSELVALLRLGLSPVQTYVLGKPYSTNAAVAAAIEERGVNLMSNTLQTTHGAYATTFEGDVGRMWQKVVHDIAHLGAKRIIILDEGGFCLRAAPQALVEAITVVGIEQTTSGLRLASPFFRFPVIEVATSAAKRIIEPPVVSAAVFGRVRAILDPSRIVGVVGLGAIGATIAADLVRGGHTVFVYDAHPAPESVVDGATLCPTLDDLFVQVDYVLGCTGVDLGAGAWLETATGSKTLISCSSGDIEFRSLLLLAEEQRDISIVLDPFADVLLTRKRLALRIVRGGFPVNFDGAPDSAPPADIEMTRSLLVGAVLQAAYTRGTSCGAGYSEMLNVALQRFVVTRWLNARAERGLNTPYVNAPEQFNDLDFVRRHSSGVEHDTGELSKIFD